MNSVVFAAGAMQIATLAVNASSLAWCTRMLGLLSQLASSVALGGKSLGCLSPVTAGTGAGAAAGEWVTHLWREAVSVWHACAFFGMSEGQVMMDLQRVPAPLHDLSAFAQNSGVVDDRVREAAVLSVSAAQASEFKRAVQAAKEALDA